MRNRVVVTGIGTISGLGVGRDAFGAALIAGDSAIRPVAAFSTAGCRSHLGAPLHGFDPGRFIEPIKLRRMDEVGCLAVATTRLALEDAGLGRDTDRVGVSLGSYTAGSHSTVAYLKGFFARGASGVTALGFSNTVGNAPGSLASIEFGLRGPNVSFAQKEASAMAALAYAVGLLRAGRVAAMLAGGVDDLEEQFFRGHDRFRALSPTDGGEEASRPFDRRRNGFVLGAGGFVLALEERAAAMARGAEVHAEVLGVGARSSPVPINAWPSDPSHLAGAMRVALDDAGTVPDMVDVVFASANATRQLDRTEAAAIGAVFGARAVPVVSVKGALGESGASGAASLAGAILALARALLPPTVGFADVDPACAVDVSSAARPASGPVALVNSFASGGAAYSLVVRVGGG